MNKSHLKCDVTDGSIVDGLRQLILFSFILDEPTGLTFFLHLKQYTTKKEQIFFEYYNILIRS